MSDQPKPTQPPDQPKTPEPKANAADSKETAPKTSELPASQKSAQPEAEKTIEQPADAGVKVVSPDGDTTGASKPTAMASAQPTTPAQSDATEPAKPATAPLTTDQSAEPTSPQKTADTSDKPAVAGATSVGTTAASQEPDKDQAEPDPSEKAPGTPDKPTVAGTATTGTPATSTAPLSPPSSATGSTGQPSATSPAEKPAATGSPAPTQSPTGTAPLSPPPAQPSAPAPSAASMQQRCPNCGHRNRPGVLVCENCGTNLLTGKASVAGTRDLLREQEAQEAGASTASAKPGTAPLVDSAEMRAVQSAGSTVFEDSMVLRIEIEGGATPILVYPKQEIIFGRRDPTSGGMPDVDLTPYAGYRMGVSRRHAAIRLQDKRLDVSDLGSSNGTFLNGTRLSAHRPYQVRDGDEIRLGQMVMKVFFQTNTGRK